MSSFNDHHGDLSPTYLNDNIRCYSYIVKDFGLRTNTVRDFCKANKLVRTYLVIQLLYLPLISCQNIM